MIILDKEQICLLELIKVSLFGNIPIIPNDVDWEKVFISAKTQCIVPLVSNAVPEEFRNDWQGIAYQSKARCLQLLYEQNFLVNLLKSNNISFVIIKGTAAAIYFPIPSLRSFGDIDFFVSNDYLVSAIRVLKENGYSFLNNNERHYEFEKNGVIFELHTKFSSQFYNDIDHFISIGLNNAVTYKVCNSAFPGLPDFYNGLVLLGHIMHHLKFTGVGIRQIIDWMMFVHKKLDDYAWENHFKKLAREAGLEKLALNVTYMCKKWLGLPNEITWCDDADEEIADQLLIRVIDDGNFGRDRAPFENIRICIKNEGLFMHLQHTGIENSRLAQNHKFFSTFAWLYQIFRYVGLGIYRLFTSKKVFRNDKKKLRLEELWKRLE